jgi:SnoaL-like domain
MDSPITAAARALVKTTDAIHRYCWLADHGHAEQIADLFAQGARLVFGEGAPKPGTLTG